MTSDDWARAVREQTALGRVLPLGGPADPLWITEQAAAAVLRGAAAGADGVGLGALRIGPARRGSCEPGAPPGAVPRGALRVDAAFDAVAGRPIPAAADGLREVLWTAARDRLGLDVASVDLTVTGLLEGGASDGGRDGDSGAARGSGPPDAPREVPGGEAAAAVSSVPGVAGVSSRLGGFPPGVRAGDEGATAQISVAAGHRALDVARAVHDCLVTAAGPGPVTVVVTDAA